MAELTIDPKEIAEALKRHVESYKPAHAHWERFFEATTADREHHVHVAASLFHDIAPAARMGIPAVWINRLGETSDLPRAVARSLDGHSVGKNLVMLA